MENKQISPSTIFLHFLRLIFYSFIFFLLIFICFIFLSELIFLDLCLFSLQSSFKLVCIFLEAQCPKMKTLLQIFLPTRKVQKDLFTVPAGCYIPSAYTTQCGTHLVFNSMTLGASTLYWYVHCYLHSTPILPQGPDLMNCNQTAWFVFVQFVLPV